MEATSKPEAEELHEYAVAEDNIREHEISMYDAIMRHKKICWWTFFFAMSAVGWYESLFPRPKLGSYKISGDSTLRLTVLCSLFHSFAPILGKFSLSNGASATE